MICPNCKTEFEGARCPNCGYSTSRTGSRIAAVVVLILLVLPSAAVGACSVVVGLDSIGHDSGGFGFIIWMVAALAAAFFAGMVYLFLNLWRS